MAKLRRIGAECQWPSFCGAALLVFGIIQFSIMPQSHHLLVQYQSESICWLQLVHPQSTLIILDSMAIDDPEWAKVEEDRRQFAIAVVEPKYPFV